MKFRRLTLILLTLLVGGNMAWGQGPWTPSSAGTYRLRSRTDNNNFDVYKDGTASAVATNRTSIGAFTITSGTYTLIFENTKTINMTGQIAINADDGVQAHLSMELGTPPSGSPASITLKIDDIPSLNGQKMAFFILKKSIANHTQHTITIKGKAPSPGTNEDIDNFVYDFSNNFVIDGSGPKLELVDGDTWTPKVKATGGKVVGSGMFRIQEGSLTLQHVTVQKFSSNYGYANLIQVFPDPKTNPKVTVNILLDHCYFHQIGGKSSNGSPVLRMQTNSGVAGSNIIDGFERKAVIQSCKFEDIFNSDGLAVGSTSTINLAEGTIRTTGNNMTTLAIYNSHFTNNYSCPVRWHGASTDSKLKVYDCRIENNFTCLANNVRGGGGLLLKGPADVQNSTIRNNRTQGDGGGIYLSTYTDFGDSNKDLIPDHSVLMLDPGTIIENNEAQGNGGGVAVDGIRMKNGGHSDLNPIDPETGAYLNGPNGYLWYAPDRTPFTVKFQLNGGRIINNKANGGYGGGVYLTRNKETTYFKLVCVLDKGEISGNKVTSATGNGGGVAIYTPDGVSNPAEIPTHVKPQNVDVTVGTLGSSNQVLIKGNEAVNGGGIYVKAYKAQYPGQSTISEVNVTVYDNTVVQENIADYGSDSQSYGLGGGLFVEEGDLTIQGNATYKPRFYKNTSMNSGGGIYLKKGNIEADYCEIIENTTTSTQEGSGGGVYLKEGIITFDHSKINTNTAALHGGGIFCKGDGTDPKIDFINSEMKANQANQHGGGIYLNEGKINITSSTIGADKLSGSATATYADANIAGVEGASSCGGGIYTELGTITIDGSTISQNLSNKKGGGIFSLNGPVNIKGSEISYNKAGYRKNSSGSVIEGDPSGTGGGIHTDGGLVTINANEDESAQTEIKNNVALLDGGGIFTGTYSTYKGKVSVYGNRPDQGGHLINITDNEAVRGSGGGVFCLGASGNERFILLRRVNLSRNKASDGGGNQSEVDSDVSSGCGGGLYLHQGLIDMNLCDVDGNTAKLNGGGINNHNGNIDILACNIRNNEAGKNNTDGSGGGAYTKMGTIGVNYWGGAIQNESRRSTITGNKATLNGGGLNTHSGYIYVKGNSDADTDRILVTGNEATKGSGGGIFCKGSGSAVFVDLLHVDLNNNKAKDGGGTQPSENAGVTSGCGGGLYLQEGTIEITDVNIQYNEAKLNGGGINNHNGDINVHGCAVQHNHAGKNNSGAGSGGGMYTNKGNIDIEDWIQHSNGESKRFESHITHNTATENGGGLNTHEGNIWINREERDHEIDIANNTANKGGGIYANAGTIYAYNAHIDNNTATENGGGANNHAGNIYIYGGTVYSNTATEGRGGGVFTYVGDVVIKPFPSTITNPTRNEGTRISNNLAKLNGGGINNHTGRVDARHATLRNNTSSLGNGGGIFCEGPHSNSTGFTIRLYDSELKENKTRGADGTDTDPTGRGGGIYLKYGSIYAHNSDIIENFAMVNGGGLDNHDGTILAYGCNIIENHARTGKGGGIYTETGNITTGPSLVGSTSNATVIRGNVAHINGGGINNHNGNIFLNGDHILNNVAETGDGGGIYIKNGIIDMYGGKIVNNEATKGNGGGVWSGGGRFEIQKRQGKPVMALVDADVLSGTQARIHYHLIDKGNGDLDYPTGPTGSHGVIWGNESDVTDAEVGNLGGASSQAATASDQGDEDNCFKVTITGLSAGGTYYVKTYATNSEGQTTYSDVTSFTTYTDKPVVITGSVSDIKATTVEGNGKILFDGTTEGSVANIKRCGVQVYKKGTTPETSHLYQAPEIAQFFTVGHSIITGLDPNTEYVMRAYATTKAAPTYPNDYAFGEAEEFKTLKNVPNLNGNVVAVTNITAKEATFTFTIPAQSQEVKAYGFVWSTDDDPALSEDHSKHWTESLAAGSTKEITVTIDTLHGATHYYVRAFATFEDFDHGADPTRYAMSTPTQFFTKDAAGNPTTRAIRLTDISQTGVTFIGKVIDKGAEDGKSVTITEYGVCYKTTSGPTITDNKVTILDDIDIEAEYTNVITGLSLNQTYYLRAYATNSAGKTGYSNEFTFTTLMAKIPHTYITDIDNIGQNSAQVYVTVDSQGGGDITDWGVKYGTTENIDDPTTIDINKPGDDGSGILSGTTFEADLPKTGEADLVKKTYYYVWVYATNNVGTYTTSHYVKFRTQYDEPEATLLTVKDITFDAGAATGNQNSAKAKATVTPKGSPDITKINTYGVCWSINENPVRMTSDYTDSHYHDTVTSADLDTPVTFFHTFKQKYPNTKYYVRAYASVNDPSGDNLEDIVYSAQQEFITLPVMQTDGASNITHNSATLSGTIVSRDVNGYLKNGYYGICWGTSANPTKGLGNFVEEEITESHGTSYPYTLNATGLSLNTTYYYRAYYYKGGDFAYANQAASTFKTKNYLLTVESANPTQGSVNPTAVGMNKDEYVNVYAIPVPGYELDSWSCTSGTISGANQNPVTFTMGESNATLTATFKQAEYTITVQADPIEGGTASGGGSGFHYNDITTITATVNSGYEFVNWTLNGEEVSTEGETNVTVTGNAIYVANFKVKGSKGNTSMNTTIPAARPKDIYPAPAREPWDWDDDFVIASDTLNDERGTRDVVVPIDDPTIMYNTALTGKGGGIYMENSDPANPTELIVKGGEAGHEGKIMYNYAAEAGGGIYINEKAYMQMKGHCWVNGNWVKKGKLGGGIYLAGRLYVGDEATDAKTAHALKANRNFAFDKEMGDTIEIAGLVTTTNLSGENDKARNNVHLSRNEYDYDHTATATGDDDANVITLLSDISGTDALGSPYTSLGFNVKHGFCPVVATSFDFGEYYNNAERENTTIVDGATLHDYEAWMDSLMPTGKLTLDKDGPIFEDSETYIAIHTNYISQPFRSKFIYLWGSWTNPAVGTDPEVNSPMNGTVGHCGHYKILNSENKNPTTHNDTLTASGQQIEPLEWEIYSEEGLAWFSSYVNGLNVFATGDVVGDYPGDTIHRKYNKFNSMAKAKLMADMDLEAHLWVPIGSVTKFNGDDPAGGFDPSDPTGSSDLYTDNNDHHFNGYFDGNGHYIRGIDCRFLTGIRKFGVFGELAEGAIVKNIFVDSCKYMTDKWNVGYQIGGISGLVSDGAVLSACEARTKVDAYICDKATTKIGGIAGEVTSGGLVHSVVGLPEIIGSAKYVGGLVGDNKGDLYNSFANPRFPDASYIDTIRTGNAVTDSIFFGGLVGYNKGIVENCYSRLQDVTGDGKPDEPIGTETRKSIFGWFAGSNESPGYIKFSYAPKPATGERVFVKENDAPANVAPIDHGLYTATIRKSGKYGFKHRDHQIFKPNGDTIKEDYTVFVTKYTNNNFIGGLQMALMNWVNERKTGTDKEEYTFHPWMRSMATSINDDLPIHNIKKTKQTTPPSNPETFTTESLWNSVGSKDSLYMDYRTDVNDLLAEYTTLDPSIYPTPAIYLYEDNDENDATPNVSVSNIGTTNNNVQFAIHQDVGITVSGTAASKGLNARVGIMLLNKRRTPENDFTNDPNWHLFSSTLSGKKVGLDYRYADDPTWVSEILGKPYHVDEVWINHVKFDPPKTRWFQSDKPEGLSYTTDLSKIGYFPTNTPYGRWRGASNQADANLNDEGNGGFYDWYVYNEEYYHWVNYKRASYGADADHWHLDHDGQPEMNHFNIPFFNTEDTELSPGEGHLVALSSESMLMADGTLNQGNQSITVTTSTNNTHSPNLAGYDQEWRRLNLVGNPYQSYLDFDKFAAANSLVLSDAAYAVRDDDDYSYIFYVKGGSKNSRAAGKHIHPHQGFFVRLPKNPNATFPHTIYNSVTFNEGMRVAGKSISPFRGDLDYPLVNLLCTDENGKGDYTTIEIGRPDPGGSEKMKNLHIGNGLIYSRMDETDCQTVFAPVGVKSVPVRFKALEDGLFTINWTLENGLFSYVHLIDNITGADVDCLAVEEYKFEGKTNDYLSRFKLVFEVTDIEEYDDDEPSTAPFAFMFGEELVVNGEGTLEMYDLAGRCLMKTRANGGQSSFGLPKVASGMYLFRLIGNGQTRVQKMVINNN